jgi:hypothetical protein
MPSPLEQREAATLAFDNAGREITQAFDTMNANLTLAAGTLGVLLTVLGAGQLFGNDVVVQVGNRVSKLPARTVETVGGIPKLSDVSLLLLAAAFPLIVRFFVRATLGYQQLLRYINVQKSCWRFLSGAASWTHAQSSVDLYVTQWKTPHRLRHLLVGSLTYGFAWVFALSACVVTWGFITAPHLAPKLVAAGFLVLALAWEIVTLSRHAAFELPTAEELTKIDAEVGPQSGGAPASASVVEWENGIIISRRRIRRLSGD